MDAKDLEVVQAYDAVLDSRKRILLRGELSTNHYHVRILKNGVVILEPLENEKN